MSTIATFVGDGVTTNFAFTFDYLRKEFVKVQVEGVTTPFVFHSVQTIQITPAPADGDVIIIRRETVKDRLVTFVDGSILIANDLNVAALQALHIAAEAFDNAAGSLLLDEFGAYSAGFRRISDLGSPVGDNDAATKEFVIDTLAGGGGALVPATRQVIAGSGLTGGGALSGDVTLALAGGYVPETRLISAGSGLTGGGALSADRTLAVAFASVVETSAGTITDKAVAPASLAVSRGLTYLTPVLLSSNPTHDFNIPNWATEIQVMWWGASVSDTSSLLVRLGTSAAFEDTGYSGAAAHVTATSPGSAANATGFSSIIGANTDIVSGRMTITRFDLLANTWLCDGISQRTSNGVGTNTGSKTLGDILTRIRILRTFTGGAYDAGFVNVSYR